MAITLLIIFCILFAAGIYLDYRKKINHFKQNELSAFLKTIAEQKITLGSILSDEHKFYAPPLMRNRNFVHKIFTSTDGEYFLYIRCGDGDPVIQAISQERALGSRSV
jgi:hypothetical protein